MRLRRTRMIVAGAALVAAGISIDTAWAAERVTVTGEFIDTWCYLSSVMGPPQAVVGTAHHTCAVWCAAGGIPVGLLGEDGELYMVLQLEGAGTADGRDQILALQSNKVTAEGELHRRDGLNYLLLDRIVANAGITVKNHTDFGFIPPSVAPDDVIERLKKQ